jgi:hypothetical protein
VLQLKTFGPGWESNPPFDISLSGNRSEAKLHSGVVKAPPGEYTIAFYGAAVAKYRYNPFGVNLAEGEVRKAEEAVQKVVAELMQKTQQAVGAAVEQKAAADAEVAEWTKRKMEAEKVLAVAKEQLKQAQSKAEPRDTAEIIVSEPVTVRVLPPG